MVESIEEQKTQTPKYTIEHANKILAESKKWVEENKKREEEHKAFNDRINATLNASAEFDAKWEKFKSDFDGVMNDMVTKMLGGGLIEPEKYKHDPV